MQAVAERASLLSEHARSDRFGFRYLGGKLASDLREVQRRYDRLEFESAGFLLLRATDNCVACHVRLEAGDSPLAEDFAAETALATLPLEQRARLQVATRRFDDALASFETLLAAPDVRATNTLGALVDYLVVSVRVRRDFDRALATLERFAARPDIWPELQTDLEEWRSALREFTANQLEPPSLALGIQLTERAARRGRFVADRRSLVHFLLASAVLYQVVERELPLPELAHAYYLLGLQELHIGRDFWTAQGELFLETAIRLAPDTPVAGQAYALLEEEILAGYTGSGGLQLPEDEMQRLMGLRALIEAHRAREL